MNTDWKDLAPFREQVAALRGALTTVAQWDTWATDWLQKHPFKHEDDPDHDARMPDCAVCNEYMAEDRL